MQKKYTEEKWDFTSSVTLNNFQNMLKRLQRRKVVSEFIITYYSVVLLVMTLTAKYYGEIYDLELSEFFGIICSITILAFSLIINNANYGKRIESLTDSIIELKGLRKTLGDEGLEVFGQNYDAILKNTEMCTSLDFFITVKGLCDKYGVPCKKVKRSLAQENQPMEVQKIHDYLSELNVLKEITKLYFEYAVEAIVIVLPIIVYVLCFII